MPQRTPDRASQRQSRADQIDREIGEAAERLVRGRDATLAHRLHSLTTERARLLAPRRKPTAKPALATE